MEESEEILLIQDMRESGFDDGYILAVISGEIEPVTDRDFLEQ